MATSVSPASSGSAKWTEELHKLFVELCAVEVIKGNRVGASLSKEGWATVQKELARQKDVVYTNKQFKNHWEKMKGEYQIFKKLKFGESGLGWNETTKTIEAPAIWWIHSTQANPKIAKFKNRDLSLIMQYYDTLFGDIVATGERARAPNTYSAVHLDVGEEFTEVVFNDGEEGSGDSDDNVQTPPSLFPSSSLKSGRSSGSKMKKSGAEVVREGLEGLVAAMSCRNTQSTAAQINAANDDASLNAAIDLLDSMEQVPPGSDLYYFAGQHFRDKLNRQLFLKARNNDIRYGQLVYNFKAEGRK